MPADLRSASGPRRRRWRERRAVVLAAGMLVGATAVGGLEPTEAAWRNSEHATTTVTAVTIAAPTVSSCTYGAGLVSWTATFALTGLAPGTTVRYRLYNPGTTTIAASASFDVTSATLAVPIASGGLLGRWRVEFEVVRGGWTSTVAVGHVVTLVGLFGSCGPGA